MAAKADNPASRRRASRLGAFVGLLALAAGDAVGSDPPVLSGTQIQAAFIYNFTKFVEWPADAFASRTQPIVIGILGSSPLTDELTTIVEGRKVNGRPILVRAVADGEDLEPAQVLFVGAAEDARFAALKPLLDQAPILTVGESEGFAASGGAFRFVQHEDKLRFEINMASVEQSGLKVSGELQKLAIAVRREP